MCDRSRISAERLEMPDELLQTESKVTQLLED
jgi:hypothetical protein